MSENEQNFVKEKISDLGIAVKVFTNFILE